MYGDGADDGSSSGFRTAGEAFVESDQLKAWRSRFSDGGPNMAGNFQSDRVPIQGGFRALVTSADASAGTLVPLDQRGLLEPGLVRPLTLRQLLTIVPTTSDAVEYIREASRVSAAAPVAEATGANTGALTDATGRKPEAGITFARETVNVRTFAVWVPATKRVVSDAPGLREYIDTVLTDDLGLEVEDQVIAGAGTGESFTGILNAAGTIPVPPPTTAQSLVHVLRRGIREVRVQDRRYGLRARVILRELRKNGPQWRPTEPCGFDSPAASGHVPSSGGI